MVNYQKIMKETLREVNLFFTDQDNYIFSPHFEDKETGSKGKAFKLSNYQFNKYPNNSVGLSSLSVSMINSIFRDKLKRQK